MLGRTVWSHTRLVRSVHLCQCELYDWKPTNF